MDSTPSKKILDGREASIALKDSLVPRIERLSTAGIIPGLATVIVGDDPASKIYVSLKHKACKELDIASFQHELEANTSMNKIESLIARLNDDDRVHGILVQVPLPGHLDPEQIITWIDPRKDVDGFHPSNVGRLMRGQIEGTLVSCTPAGIMYLLVEHHGIDLTGMEVVIVSRSNIVGKPLIPLFLQQDATVTTCHTKTKKLAFHTRRADLVIAGTGQPKMFTKEYFSDGVIIVDVGIHRIDGNLCGDVDFEDVLPVASKITPVPGGVGPMTIAALMRNTVQSAEALHGNRG
ncbi:bifunctional 5,10-methylene-tetrahydrofolate dehydrogenase/5,10-methylene-tetrahydrofolate cyclohydrolase [Candidatus Bathyarchaeota archaeon]|nr:bifunctional 5,10-methylene-tetrahydrofolate dehydrogenase/5,10-methylene-tetrahydrofolate cyclohydrolase [Candidatus Bathyarchaeota archaeon]